MSKRRSDAVTQQHLSDGEGEITPHVKLPHMEKLCHAFFAAKAREAKAAADKEDARDDVFTAIVTALSEGDLESPRYQYTNGTDEMLFEVTDEQRLSVRKLKKEELE